MANVLTIFFPSAHPQQLETEKACCPQRRTRVRALESLSKLLTKPCLQSSKDARALVRLQCDHVNRSVVPSFYRYLQAQTDDAIVTGAKEYLESLQGLTALLERAEREIGGVACGLWAESGELGLLDAMAGPCTYYFFFIYAFLALSL